MFDKLLLWLHLKSDPCLAHEQTRERALQEIGHAELVIARLKKNGLKIEVHRRQDDRL